MQFNHLIDHSFGSKRGWYAACVIMMLTFVCEFRCISAQTRGVAFPLILCPGVLFFFTLFFASSMHVICCSQRCFCFRYSPRMSLRHCQVAYA